MSAEPVAELKTRARLGLNAALRGDFCLLAWAESMGCKPVAAPAQWRLGACLALIAQSIGFQSWEHALRILGGQARAADDMGAFWHAPACCSLLNHWFGNYEQARAFLEQTRDHVLLPYRRQYLVVGAAYLKELSLPLEQPEWQAVSHDLVAEYGSVAWQRLCVLRLGPRLLHWSKPEMPATPAG